MDSILALVSALKEMGYLSGNLEKYNIFHTRARERIHPESILTLPGRNKLSICRDAKLLVEAGCLEAICGIKTITSSLFDQDEF